MLVNKKKGRGFLPSLSVRPYERGTQNVNFRLNLKILVPTMLVTFP